MYGRGTLEDHERKQRPGTRLLYSHSTSCSAEQPAVVLNSLLSEFTSDQFASTASIDTNGSHSVLAVVGAEARQSSAVLHSLVTVAASEVTLVLHSLLAVAG